MRLPAILSFVFVLIMNKTFAQKDFVSDSLSVVWGKDNYQGRKDVSAKVKIYSTGDKIVVEAEVTDDKVIHRSDPVNTDHVEIWYALPAAHRNEHLLPEGINFSFDPPQYYYRYDSSFGNNPVWKFYSVASGKEYPYDAAQKAWVYAGQVHYGVFPDNRKVHMYGREHYHMFEKSVGEKLGHADHGVQYKSELTRTGYKVVISITPLGLGFVEVPSMKDIRFMVDVVDADGEKQETILSTSGTGHTGAAYEFNEVRLAKPLKTNVTTVPEYIFDSLHYAPIVMFNEKGYWSGITIDRCCTKHDECSMVETVFLRTPFGYKKWKIGETEIEKFTRTVEYLTAGKKGNFIAGGIEEVYFIHKEKFRAYRRLFWDGWNFKGLNKEFLMTDGAVGLLLFNHQGGYRTDSCAEVVSRELRIIRIKDKKSQEIFKLSQDDCSGRTLMGTQVYEGLKVERIYWAKEGSVLMIEGSIPEKGSRKYKVSLGAGGKLSVGEVKK